MGLILMTTMMRKKGAPMGKRTVKTRKRKQQREVMVSQLSCITKGSGKGG